VSELFTHRKELAEMTMKELKILGDECPKCKKPAENAEAGAAPSRPGNGRREFQALDRLCLA
jgi:hypothetical protein